MASIDNYPYNLGTFQRKVSTAHAAAQKWFDRGLTWSYAFHHEESARCFERAIKEDPKCAMAYWGRAFALGPNYNKPWDLFDEKELKMTLDYINNANTRAKQNASGATNLERALIDAIQTRVPQGLHELAFRACNEAYAEAMALVYKEYPNDLDVVALYADSIMNLSAWDLWDLRTGEPTPGARSLEAKAVLEAALALKSAHEHPGILHLYIHLMEMSKTPEVALVAADHLRSLTPDAGHLVHMPSHLDILIGDYRRAVSSNADACLADEKYLAEHGGDNFYTFYRLHDYHSLIYAAMFSGQFEVSMDWVARMESSLPESLLRIESPPMADWMESWVSVRVHVLVRFGRWKEIFALDLPQNQELYCVTTAMIHYGKGIAFAATGDIDNATKHRDQLFAATDRIPLSRIAGDFPNKANVVIQIGKAMIDGEIEYRKGNFDAAFEHLCSAIDRDDALTCMLLWVQAACSYSAATRDRLRVPADSTETSDAEPWPWMVPTRHAYGALLMEQGRVEEATQAYAADLGFDDSLPRARQHPNNVWALHGYHECLVKLGRTEEAKIIQQQLRLALAVADVDVKASCYCRTSCCGS